MTCQENIERAKLEMEDQEMTAEDKQRMARCLNMDNKMDECAMFYKQNPGNCPTDKCVLNTKTDHCFTKKEKPLSNVDCADEFNLCKNDKNFNMNDADDQYKCLILRAADANDVRCAGVLTRGDENEKGDARIGMHCLP